MDRPSRKTKAVNYCEPDCDDDDDFACVKAPPSKKARDNVKQQEHKKSSSKLSSQESNSQSSQKSRRPLDERLCERDLEAAITLSLLHNTEEDQSPASKDIKDPIPSDENTDPSSLRLSNCSVNAAILGLDEITCEKVLPASSRQRKAATEGQRKNSKEDDDDDDDYQPKLTPDSESDEDFSAPDESEDEEFTVKKDSKTKKKESVPKKIKSPTASKKEKQQSKSSKSKSVAAPASTPVRNPLAPKLVSKHPASSPTLPTFKPVVSIGSPVEGRIPKWNPPGQIGKSPTSSHNPSVKSPGQGLRLGLSRYVRVKPLHPSVASH